MLLLTFGNPLILINQNAFWRNNSKCLFWNRLRKESFWVIRKHGVSAAPLIPNVVLPGLLLPCVSCTSPPIWSLAFDQLETLHGLFLSQALSLWPSLRFFHLPPGCLEIDWVVVVHLRGLRNSKIGSTLWDQPDGSMSTPHHCIEVVIQSLKVMPNCLQHHYITYLISLPFFPGLPIIKIIEKREKGRKRRRRRRWKTGGIQCLVLKSSPSYSATDFNQLRRPPKVLGFFF